jgi:CRP-like cAMP-binding protein
LKHLSTTPADTVEFSQIARKLQFFASMKMGMLEKILAGLQVLEFARGEKVCVQGDAGDFFFVVQKGRLEVSVRKGGLHFAKRVAILEQGDCFGEMALLHQAPRNATVACLAKSRIFALSALHFQAVLAENPDFARNINDLSAVRQLQLDLRFD